MEERKIKKDSTRITTGIKGETVNDNIRKQNEEL